MINRRRYVTSNYRERVLRTRPIAYWQLGEATGTTITDRSGSAFNGTYSNVTWDGTVTPQGTQGASFNGTTSYANVYSSAFDGASGWNQNEGCILLWLKASASGVWTDATIRYLLNFLSNGTTDYLSINKTATNNQISFVRIGNSGVKSVSSATFSGVAWQSVMMSWSVSRDQFKAFANGAQLGTTQTGLLAASDTTLIATQTAIGAFSTTPANVWSGFLAHVTIWDTPEDASKIALMTNFV